MHSPHRYRGRTATHISLNIAKQNLSNKNYEQKHRTCQEIHCCQNHAVGHRLLDVVYLSAFFFFIIKDAHIQFTRRCIGTDRERSCTYHWVHKLRSMSVRALQQRMAVFIRTEASFSGSAPSKEGDQ